MSRMGLVMFKFIIRAVLFILFGIFVIYLCKLRKLILSLELSDDLFVIPALKISGNLITVSSIFGYVCNLFLLTPKIISLVIIVTYKKLAKKMSRRKKVEREATKIRKQKSRAQVKWKQTPWQATETKEVEREATKIRVQKSRTQAKRKQTPRRASEMKEIER